MYKVVICDDERIIREGLKQAIPWDQYHFDEVLLAKDGVEALSLIREHRPDLVITDIRMPRMDGVQLLDAISDIPCQKMILSSYDDFEYMQAGIHHHVLDYLLKPIDTLQLCQRLEQFVPVRIQAQPIHSHRVFQPLMKLEYPDYYVNYVVQHIHQNYYRKWYVTDLASHLAVSESYLIRVFKAHVGITILDYLNRYRVNQALSLLQSGDKHYEIAEKVGFSDYKAFSYHFKKYLKMAPRTYVQSRHSAL
ncbi:response regulator transcription factor [Staphylococcus lutrae]|uniref:DNA-binding response regulator n=1 Tax=Staphylococcus lutrae TaxID=155085 RepID=A0AAC9RVR4_9STAP|nr:response regulator [Staphylococcus lutrae]ARJ50707.1 DNA-binding response regulator [Staphylococcus lutrae]PNZ34755.1 DNA-binding response regulator [Staphylococcus lutrae]